MPLALTERWTAEGATPRLVSLLVESRERAAAVGRMMSDPMLVMPVSSENIRRRLTNP